MGWTKHVVFCAAIGCGSNPSTPPAQGPASAPKTGVHVDAPGVNVDVQGKNGKGKVKVDAPGVNVDVNTK
jgi:hypothetical protein